MITINGKIFENVFTAAQWVTQNPILGNRVQGFDSTNLAFKIGDGITAWVDLPFYYPTSVIDDTELDYPSGTSLPITLNFATTYSQYGNYPKFMIVLMDGDSAGLDVTSQTTINRGVVFPSTALTISVNDDGSGATENSIRIIIYK